MPSVGSKIKVLLSRYLAECSLNKIAFFTNFIPQKNESEELTPYFSYICFCTSSLSEQSSILFNKYWARFKKVPFNVFISSIEECIVSRQYNFISIKCDTNDSAKKMLSFIRQNKRNINRKYPILVRLIVESDDLCNNLGNIKPEVVCELSFSDVVIRIDK